MHVRYKLRIQSKHNTLNLQIWNKRPILEKLKKLQNSTKSVTVYKITRQPPALARDRHNSSLPVDINLKLTDQTNYALYHTQKSSEPISHCAVPYAPQLTMGKLIVISHQLCPWNELYYKNYCTIWPSQKNESWSRNMRCLITALCSFSESSPR